MLEYEDIEKSILPEIESAKEYADQRAGRRNKAWDRYRGKPLGNEVKGRSKFVTREIMDTIEWMMPYFMRTFASGDTKIDLRIDGQEPWVGEGLMQEILKRVDCGTPSVFPLFYTWFKDALVSDTSFVKLWWEQDYEIVEAEGLPDLLSEEQLHQLEADEDFTITSKGEPYTTYTEQPAQRPALMGSPYVPRQSVEQIFYKGVKATVRRKTKDDIAVANTPHWEFIVDPKSKDINDDFGKGHITEVSLDYLKRINRAQGGDYFQNLDDVIATSSNIDTDTGETSTYMEDENAVSDQLTGGKIDTQDLKGEIKYIEWSTKEDVNEDGFLENIVCYFANNKLIRWELDKDSFIPFAAVKPIIDCFKFYGISYADFIVEIQNLKTMLMRRILDNFDFQNSGRWRVDPNANVNRSELLDNRPGGVVTAKKDAVENLFTGAFNPRSISILDYVDRIKENRTGVQGLQPQLSGDTATEVRHLQTTTIQRLELIGRIFAETGLRDFYYKAARLFQRYLSEPFIVMVHGNQRQITPEMLQGRITTTVRMGVEKSVGLYEVQQLNVMIGVLGKLSEMAPGFLGPEEVYNIATQVISSTGFEKQIGNFIRDRKKYLEAIQKSQKARMQAQQQASQMQQQMQQMQLSIDKMEVDVKARKAEADKQIRSAGVMQKDKASQREHMAALEEVKTKRLKVASDVLKQGRDNR